MLQQGSRGSAVTALQKKLGVTADGIFGPATAAALRSYQRSHGLAVDGIAGPQTLGKMGLSAGGGSGKSSSGSKPAASGAEAQKFAEDYGYQLAFLKSDKELYGIFLDAMNHDLDATKFIAKVKNSKWYKTHGETYRTNLAQRTTDPASYRDKAIAQQATVGDLARTMGADLTSQQLAKIADDSIMFGWNDNQLRNTLANYIKTSGTAQRGEAGHSVMEIMQTAWRNGVNLPRETANKYAVQIANGSLTVEDMQRRLRSSAAGLAPGFAKELEGGMDLYDLATPYMQSMAQTLEMNPSDIDLFNPTIRKALGSSGDKDGKPGSTPLWQFEQELRQDPRYMKTQKAQDSTMAVGHQVLRDMGLVG